MSKSGGTVANQIFRTAFAERFGRLLENIGISGKGAGRITEVASRFNVSEATAHKWLSAKAIPEPHRWKDICDLLNCSLDELFFGVSPFLACAVPNGYIELKIIDGIHETQMITRRVLIEAGTKGFEFDGHYLFKVNDNAMEPFVMMGDWVVVNNKPAIPINSGISLLCIGSRFYIRRVQVRLGGDIVLIPENKRYESEVVTSMAHINCSGFVDPTVPRFIGEVVGRLLVHR